MVGNEITERDQACLKSLTKITYRSEKSESGDEKLQYFEFHFAENEFFTN